MVHHLNFEVGLLKGIDPRKNEAFNPDELKYVKTDDVFKCTSIYLIER